MKNAMLSILVKNRVGVLSRIAALFSRRGYNIESLSVCATEVTAVSRMTITVVNDRHLVDQITKQLLKQEDVLFVKELNAENSVSRELLIVKLKIASDKRSQIIDICSIFKAKTVDITVETMTLELTGRNDKIDAFMEVLQPYEILEMARSGVSAIQRGEATIKE